MADKIGIGSEVRKLRLGDSFVKNGHTSFHTLRYDFKPASVDVTKVATVAIGQGNQVAVTVPHIEGSGTSQTIFKGSKKQYTKECVLIIDPTSGEVTLERLTNNIQVKKTRAEGSGKAQHTRPITPVEQSATRKASPNEKHSPSQKNPPSPKSSPYRLSPSQRNSPPHQNKNSSTSSNSQRSINNVKPPIVPREASMPILSSREPENVVPEVGLLSDSSSGSSSSDSSSESSDSESDNEMETVESVPAPAAPLAPMVPPTPPIPNQHTNTYPNMPQFSQLSEDLQLSESGSDSD